MVVAMKHMDLASVQHALRGFLAQLLDMPVERIDADVPTTAYGMDSLLTVRLLSQFERSAGIRLPMDEFEGGESLAEMAQTIHRLRPRPAEALSGHQ